MPSPCLDLNLRTYGASHAFHSHAFDQLVLPIDGDLLIEVGGREAHLHPGRIAVVARGQSHTQMAEHTNRSLIIDLAPQALIGSGEALLSSPFHQISPAALKLAEFMDLTLAHGTPHAQALAHWTSLLLQTLGQNPQPPSRLERVCMAVMQAPGEDWSVTRMANVATISPSRLHTLFREELGCTPQAWVCTQRMRLAHSLLHATQLSVGEIAWRCGYSDQSAFARAFRRTYAIAPAGFRQTDF